jgi:nitrite reductase/ring-hydroxylating ferredoxin subunit
MMKMKFGVFVLVGLVITTLFACKKSSEDQGPAIPYASVNFSLNPNSTQFLELNHVGGWVPVTGGYRGIILYRLSESEFMAYERACPYDPTADSAQIRVDNSGLLCYCPKCKSKYLILDGSPNSGPSHWSLKQYHTMYDGTFLYVTN